MGLAPAVPTEGVVATAADARVVDRAPHRYGITTRAWIRAPFEGTG